MANIFLGVGDGKDEQIYNRSFCTAGSGLLLRFLGNFHKMPKKTSQIGNL